MSNAIEFAARTYATAWAEPDPEARARLLEACWAEDGRLVTGGSGFNGRAALAAAMDAFFADPQRPTVRLTSPIDVQGRMFRLSAVAEYPDGRVSAESHDAGEVDADGRIAILLTFVGPLPRL